MRARFKCIEKKKSWCVKCKGKIISKHISFWHAQQAVERHLKARKIDNSYTIEPLK